MDKRRGNHSGEAESDRGAFIVPMTAEYNFQTRGFDVTSVGVTWEEIKAAIDADKVISMVIRYTSPGAPYSTATVIPCTFVDTDGSSGIYGDTRDVAASSSGEQLYIHIWHAEVMPDGTATFERLGNYTINVATS